MPQKVIQLSRWGNINSEIETIHGVVKYERWCQEEKFYLAWREPGRTVVIKTNGLGDKCSLWGDNIAKRDLKYEPTGQYAHNRTGLKRGRYNKMAKTKQDI